MSNWLNAHNMKDLMRLVITILLVLYVSVGCLSQTPRKNRDNLKDLREESLNETTVGSGTSAPSHEGEEEENGPNGEDENYSNQTRIPSGNNKETKPEDDASPHLTASLFLLATCLILYAITSLNLRFV